MDAMRAPLRLLPLVALAVAVANGCADDARIELLPAGPGDAGAEGATGGSGGTPACAEPCTGERPYCFEGRCVECLETEDCGSAELACDPSLECSQSCATGTECGDKHCDLGTLACVECSAATVTVDCGGDNYYCVLGHCWECANDEDCGTGQTCDPDEHHCSGTSG